MPNGIHHDNMWKMGWAVILPTSIYAATISIDMSMFLLAGYAFGRYINPDTDQPGMTVADGLAINHLKIVGWILIGYFTIYGIAFRRKHRSFWTHFPGISTFIRLAWLLWWIGLLYYFKVIQFQWWDAVVIFGFWLGLGASDMMHYLSDLWFSGSENT